MKKINRDFKVRDFHQAKWNEPIIFELHNPGHRGIEVPLASEALKKEAGDVYATIPQGMRRQKAPALPCVSQARVLRHFLRITQEVIWADLNVEIGQGTCTMKYSPKINERLARSPKMSELHPLQDERSVQGILEIMYKTDLLLREICGMDRVSFQPQSGSQALMTMASLIRAKVEHDGKGEQKDEIITTLFSHPSAAASAIVKGFKVRTVGPREDGYPDFEQLKALVNERTAGFICANPEDTGLYNGEIKKFTELVHSVGGYCAYDQANANGLFGITRARDAGFDMCFFNLHKSFSTPHGCGGPGTGAVGVSKDFADFLPAPVVDFDGEKYFLNDELPHSIGKVRVYQGTPQVVLKAYAWMRALGAEGLYEVAKIASLNNNYLYKRILELRGTSVPFDSGEQRVEQARYSFQKLFDETGVSTEDVQRRMCDFGLHYWTSHHPYVVPQPFTLEPTEFTSKEDIDEYADAIAQIVEEAYTNPEIVKSAPHNSSAHRNDESPFDDPKQWAISWRSYQKKFED